MSGGSFQSWVIGSAVLLAGMVVIVGALRALRERLRGKIVIHDVEPDAGLPAEAIVGLSPQLRERVRQELRRWSGDAFQAESVPLDADIKAGLVTIRGGATMAAVRTEVSRMTADTMSELSAGLQEIAPAGAQGLARALGTILPAQRGWDIWVNVVIGGTGDQADVGLSLELSQSGGAPDESTTFWAQAPPGQRPADGAAQSAVVRRLLHELLRPAAAWIAIRLVSRHLTEQRGRGRQEHRIFRRHSAELTGLQFQFAGQMSLHATRLNEKFMLGYARQALDDLEQAAKLIPDYYRPPMTQGFVHERRGWAYLRAGNGAAAERAFGNAVRAYDRARDLLGRCGNGVNTSWRDTEIEAITVRRTKCRMRSGEGPGAAEAVRELAASLPLRDTGWLSLYNAACSFAVALGLPHLSDEDRAICEWHAWDHLGRALLASGDGDISWSRILADEELDALEESRRTAFCAEIRRLRDAATDRGDPGRLVGDAMAAFGLTPPTPPWDTSAATAVSPPPPAGATSKGLPG